MNLALVLIRSSSPARCPGVPTPVEANDKPRGDARDAFTSSSTVKHFLDLVGEDAGELLTGVTVACIGPITAETAAQSGIVSHIMPENHTIPALADALVRHFQNHRT